MLKPSNYPLPWCDALGAPYWQVNITFCGQRAGWREWQAHKDMAEIIPAIDQLFHGVDIKLVQATK